METKRQSFMARVAMTLLLTVLTTVTAWADEWPEYVTDIIVVGGNQSEVNSAKSNNSGYTWCSMDLNKGAGGDYIYFGYKKSRTANTNGGYITDIIVIDAEGTNPPSTVTYDGRTYNLCSYDGGSHFEGVKGNLNSNCGSGWNIYLYYTKQEYSSTKRAVSSIDVNSTKAGSINCYYQNGNKEEEQIDLNRGISGSSDVYMHLSTVTKVNRPYPEPSMASNLVYDGQPKQLISSSYSNSNSGTLYYRVGTTGSYTSTVADVTATAAGTHTVYYYSASSSYGNSSVNYAHTMTATIAKSPNSGPTVTCADALESVGPSPSLTGTNLSTGAITYLYSTSQNGEYTTTKPTTAGTYWVTATIAADDNCYEYITPAVSFKMLRDWALHNSGDSEDDAYVISSPQDLDLLAQRVNAGNAYSGKYFRLGANITYSHDSEWNNTTSTENNYTPIGKSGATFKGHFDGKGFTVSGIRISSSSNYKGLFGYLYDGATVKNVILSDARIMYGNYSGGIAGDCNISTITNCWVKSNVCIGRYSYVGGIAGNLYGGAIIGCRSEATLIAASGDSRERYGGIAGTLNGSNPNVKHCIVAGATVPGTAYRGAVVGRLWTGSLTNNYYINCSVAGVADATNVGCTDDNNLADTNGARHAVTIGAATGVTITPTGTATTYDVSGITAYEGNNVIGFGGKLYAGATERVRLTVGYTAPADYALNGYTDGHDNALTANDDDTYTLTMTDEAATVTPDGVSLWGTASGADGSQAHPYVITTPAGLDLLASNVNGGKQYRYTYFVLGDNITYDADALTLDLDGDGNNDSNYMPVGKNFASFYGNFDGQGHTISGIRVNANGMDYIGVFGFNDGTVKNLTVSDCLFAGNFDVGAIAGLNRGTVENCHVAAGVSVTGNNGVGGVVGENEGYVLGCTSAATLSAKEYARYFGGIAGSNAGTLTDNLFTGTIGKMPDGSWGIGAITGYHNTELGSTLTNNFHTCSGMGGVGNLDDATNTDQAGAQFAVTRSTQSDASIIGEEKKTYGGTDYTGITAYQHALYYNGNYYISLWGGSGTEEDPYVIYNTEGLDKLATNVNGGTGYQDTYFVLGDNIVYTPDVLTLDLDNDGENDSNYMPVGKNGSPFLANFDGQGHTISGIRVNANGMDYIGVFGINDGTVKNLTVSDCLFAGSMDVGAIAGLNRGTVENCHVATYVSVIGESTVGGIVGDNDGAYQRGFGFVLGCTSAAALSTNNEYARYFGGIAGSNTGTLTDNLFTGTIDKMPNNSRRIGAITGYNDTEYGGTLTNNFHTCSGMGGVGNSNDATNTDQDGAQLAYEFPTANGAMGNAGSTYGTDGYTGITAYEHGLYYNGKYYYFSLWGGSGTVSDPYVIYNTAGMDKLATDVNGVNGVNGYQNTYFVLGNDIIYDANVLTLDLDGDGENDSNYMPVRNDAYPFRGIFDGQGHTISGIRVNANGLIGVFGSTAGTVKNLTVSDCLFAGESSVGAIAGLNRGTVENCHVAADVRVTAYAHVGGVVGDNNGSVLGCTSAAALSAKEYAAHFGGIAGNNSGTLTDNLFTGTIDGMPVGSRGIGAITGYNDTEYGVTLTNNFHTCSGMGGVGNDNDATNTDQAGAQFAYEFPTANGAMGNAGNTYGTGDYTGITAYANGLAYNGKFYSPSPWGGSGTAEDPYVIVNTQGMDKLANDVNGGNYYQNTYFVLANDIAYDPDVLTLDLDGDGNNDSNYMPVGNDASSFMGNFDGQGHTISGIRINTNNMERIGVFGFNDGTVKNLTVSDCLFAGYFDVGAISGSNRGTVENCHVAAYVSVTGNSLVGGVVGENEGSVLGCTSAAALSTKESAAHFGGIAGYNSGTLTDNLFTGTIGEMPDGSWRIGAITGYHNTEYGGTLTNNFHTCSGMGGVGNDNDATNTDQAGAQFAVSRSTQPDATIIGSEVTTYGGTDYTGITAYEHALYYNGKYYYFSLWGGSGTEEDPYVIYNTAGMDKLAQRVKRDNDYYGFYFVLGNDIVYDAGVLTLNLDGDGNNDSNYMPVGNDDYYFLGNFDGEGHTISGIRVNANGMNYIGVFGITAGTVKNLTVSDCLFAGDGYVGAIAGLNRGTVENCHVATYVSVTGNNIVGGVVGENEGSVLGCTSAATLSAKEYARYFGGIAGANVGTLTDNLFTGTIGKIPDGLFNFKIGAITGVNDTDYGTLTNNFHTCSGMGGVGNSNDATNTDQAGAQTAVARSTQPDATIIGEEKKTYGGTEYTGITAYENGLYYNGKYYYWSEDIVVPGDANGDGVVTISDAVAIVNYILGKAPAGFNEAAADMNGDGKVTITDAVRVVNMIAAQQ